MNNDPLFKLIQSLSTHEKGYFKKFCSIYSAKGDKHYLELFDFIEKMKTYDEQVLKSHFRRTSWIKRLPSLKNYLTSQILRSLELYHRPDDNDPVALVRQAEMLTKKSLYPEAYKAIRKTLEVAEKKEKIYVQLKALNIEYELIKYMYSPERSLLKIREINKRRREVITFIDEMDYVNSVNDELYDLYKKAGIARSKNMAVAAGKLMPEDLIARIDNSKRITFKRVGYNAITIYYAILGDAQKAFTYARKHFYLTVNFPEFFEMEERILRSIHFNYLNTCIRSNNLKEFEKNIRQFELQKSTAVLQSAKKFYMTYNLYFAYVKEKKDGPLFFKYKNSFEKEYKIHEPLLSAEEKTSLAANLAYLLFMHGKLDEAVDWNTYALNFAKGDTPKDRAAIIRIQDLIFHYEQRSFRLLESKLLSTKRFLRNNHIFYATEQCVINYLRRLMKASGSKETREIFIQFKVAVNEVFKTTETEKIFLLSFDLPGWIDKKIKQTKF